MSEHASRVISGLSVSSKKYEFSASKYSVFKKLNKMVICLML